MLNILYISFLPLLPLPSDSVATKTHNIDEVVVISGRTEGQKRSIKGQVASIDEHIGELSHVNLVRRGSYAWEPVVNNMATERVSTTIDGMKIFYACTDKMDPVTSYVESGNLQSISLNSGLSGNPQSTGNIGGSLDLKLKKAGFLELGIGNEELGIDTLSANSHSIPHSSLATPSPSGVLIPNFSTGYEANGHLQVYGADAAYSSHSFYANGGVFYRHADNYKQGGGEEVNFSQFQKLNAFANLGARLAEDHILEGTFIYDRASDVGYPALNMDVSKAEAFITSLSYKRLFHHPVLNTWETKVYYNHIVHIMDDTTRPDVEIHMDMPGKSWTSGIYSLLSASKGSHDVQLNYDLYYNRLFADMTMYPGGAAPMYMVTCPDVGTLNTGVAISDVVSLPHQQKVKLSAKLAQQWQKLNDEEGYHSLSVFFPGMKDAYYQTIGRVAANYEARVKEYTLNLGAGWGSRAPTVTEAYGYYLNNTFDQYDYIGNPRLKNESAIEVNAAVKWQPSSLLSFNVDANAFFFYNYIIGQFENRLSAMTVGAEGVKVYGNIDHATIFNTSFTAQYHVLPWLSWTGKVNYAIGRDADSDPLPLISPLAYATSLDFAWNRFQVRAEVKGNARQVNYAPKYGETETAEYAIVNLNTQYTFSLNNAHLTLRAGVENLLDRRYSTYSDWCNIPQKGRNVYVNVSVGL